MKVQQEISDETIKNVLCCGFEGGVGYWCRIEGYEYTASLIAADFSEGGKMQGDHYWHPCQLVPLVGGCAVICGDLENPDAKDDPKQHRLDRAALQRGLEVMSSKYPRHFANMLDDCRCDAETGDVFIQCCLFGEIVYG